MAIEKALEFLSALDQDESLAVKADDAFVAALHQVAGGAGFEFSEDELRRALDGEGLSDADLDQVAGGLSRLRIGAISDTVYGGVGGVADTVYGGTSSLVNPLGQIRFGSFSKTGFTR